jgi:hypothetical protein
VGLEFVLMYVRYSYESGTTSAPGADIDSSYYILGARVANRGDVSRESLVRMRRCELTPCSTSRVETSVARAKCMGGRKVEGASARWLHK